MPTTVSPRASSASTTCEPMKPAAPVTTIFSLTRRHALGGQTREVRDSALQPLADADHRLPAQLRARVRDVGAANLGIVLRKRSLDQRRLGARQLPHHLGELSHSVFHRVADVRWLVISLHEQAIDPLHLVRYVAEAASLRTVSVQRDRLVAERLHDEIRNDAAIARPHARAVRVEDANDARCLLYTSDAADDLLCV